jgi:hypothetical protein
LDNSENEIPKTFLKPRAAQDRKRKRKLESQILGHREWFHAAKSELLIKGTFGQGISLL